VASGSALLKDEVLVGRILEKIVSSIKKDHPLVPVTLKIRTGWDRDNKNALNIAKIAVNSGIEMLTIHGRTKADLYRGEAEYDTIAAVKAAINIPVVANGDINSPEKAAFVLQQTGADALMIGRAAQGRPWIFREILHFLETGQHLAAPKISEIQDIMNHHLLDHYNFYGEYAGVRTARKHIAWYCKGLKGSHVFKQHMNTIDDCQEQLNAVNHFFDSLKQESEHLIYLEAA
jgi:tRNA-dihydrouridine synthase B